MLNEFGSRPIVVRLTPKPRAFLHTAFRKASTGRSVLRNPRRPFLGPVFDQYAQPEDVSRRFLARVAKNLDGDFGDP